MLFSESNDRVTQQNDVAGQAAIATGSLGREFKNSIDARNLCQQAKTASR